MGLAEGVWDRSSLIYYTLQLAAVLHDYNMMSASYAVLHRCGTPRGRRDCESAGLGSGVGELCGRWIIREKYTGAMGFHWGVACLGKRGEIIDWLFWR